MVSAVGKPIRSSTYDHKGPTMQLNQPLFETWPAQKKKGKGGKLFRVVNEQKIFRGPGATCTHGKKKYGWNGEQCKVLRPGEDPVDAHCEIATALIEREHKNQRKIRDVAEEYQKAYDALLNTSTKTVRKWQAIRKQVNTDQIE